MTGLPVAFRRKAGVAACIALGAVALAAVLSACNSEDTSKPAGAVAAKSPKELELLKGLDQPVVLPEAALDQIFPVVAEVPPTEDDDPAPSDPTQGGALDARLAAYKPTADTSLYFTVQPNDAIPPAFVEAAKVGILFGMDNFDSLFAGFSLRAAAAARPFDVAFFDLPKANTGFRASVTSCPQTSGGWAECRPRLNIPYDAGKAARSPNWAAYDRLGANRCAFEALQRGLTAWKDFSPTGAEPYLP
jgi:hypothetical protein